MISTPFVGERSFRHDPRMRQALARAGHKTASDGPAGTALYWLLRSRRPRLAALTGRLAPADLLIVACALADCGAKLVVDRQEHSSTHAALATAGLDWILRSGECLPCLHRVRTYDSLMIGEEPEVLTKWSGYLGRNAVILGVGRDAAVMPGLANRIIFARLAGEVARLRDGRRCLLIASHEPG